MKPASEMTDTELRLEIEETELFDATRLLELYREVYKRWRKISQVV